MKRNNSYLSAVIAIIISVGCFWYSWAVLVPNVKSENDKLAQEQANTSSARTYLDELTTSKSSIEELGDLPSILSLAIPGGKDTPDLITELEAIGAKHKMIIPSIQAEDTSAGDGVTAVSSNTIDVNFSVQGAFVDVNSFISDLENDIRFMNIQSMTMTSVQNSNGDNTGSISLSLQLKAYKRTSTVAASTQGGE